MKAFRRGGRLAALLLLGSGAAAFCSPLRPTLGAEEKREQAISAPEKTYAFVNGQWFDGKGFRRQTFYAVNGLLTQKQPPKVDAEIDLKNGYVVPPFGDAHCHHFDSAYNVLSQKAMYLHDGIFYVQVMCNSRKGAQDIANQVNQPASVDVIYAHGGLDGDNSHALLTYEGIGLGYYNGKDQYEHKAEILKSRKRENDCYYIIDTEADLEKKWGLILAGKPDFIKVFLLHSENYEARKQKQGYGEGIDPKVLPQIVVKAHAAGLRVAAHVDSATDYHNALVAGVDEMAHLPGYYINHNEDVKTYQLASDDIKLTAKRNVRVIPTANLADYTSDPDDKARTRANQIRNLKLLKAAGVKFGIGTDSYGTDSLKEALYLHDLGLWNNREMLKMWCEETPQSIFPHRKIGAFKEGYEASFLVLKGDPLADFANVQQIALRCKQGALLAP